MQTFNIFKKLIAEELSAILNVEVQKIDVVCNNSLEKGDYSSSILLKISKEKGVNPKKFGEEVIENLTKKGDDSIFSKIEIGGVGFLNFFLKEEVIFRAVSKDSVLNFQDLLNLQSGKTFLIEHTSANPNKAMHIGHLRNNLLGMSIANLWEAIGAKVVRDYVNNDRGIAIAKLMWGFLRFARKSEESPISIDYWYEHKNEWSTPSDHNMSPDKFVDELYLKAYKDFEENKDVEEQVRKFVVDWEAGEKKNRELWRLVMNYSEQGQDLTLKRLNSRIDHIWNESDHYQMGKDIVFSGLDSGIFQKLDDGAILTNLKKYNLSDTVLLKRDGTSLYITQDIALTKLKKEKFKPDKMAWVIGPDQTLALKQLFAVCEQLGIGSVDSFLHITFGYLSIKGGGKMSSRKGNAIYIDDLLDDAIKEIDKQISSPEIGELERKEISTKLGIGAVKYSILKINRNTDIEFDIYTTTSFEGDSLPYIMYAYTRARSILEKKAEDLSGDFLQQLSSELTQQERELCIHLLDFNDILVESAYLMMPNILCLYIYKLSQIFNKFYVANPILSEQKDIRLRRLYIVKLTSDTIQRALGLLGIDRVERM